MPARKDNERRITIIIFPFNIRRQGIEEITKRKFDQGKPVLLRILEGDICKQKYRSKAAVQMKLGNYTMNPMQNNKLIETRKRLCQHFGEMIWKLDDTCPENEHLVESAPRRAIWMTVQFKANTTCERSNRSKPLKK